MSFTSFIHMHTKFGYIELQNGFIGELTLVQETLIGQLTLVPETLIVELTLRQETLYCLVTIKVRCCIS